MINVQKKLSQLNWKIKEVFEANMKKVIVGENDKNVITEECHQHNR